MTDKLPDVWGSRDFPVLVEVARRLDSGEVSVLMPDVAEALRMSEDDVQSAGIALERRKLVTTSGMDQWRVFDFTDITAEAYFLTGLHPSGDDAVSDLVALLHEAAAQVDDPEEKSRLQRLADSVGGVSREVLGGVLTALATGLIS